MLNSEIWAKNEEVYESVIFSEYHGMAISLLVFPKETLISFDKYQEEYEEADPTPPSIPSFR